MMHDKQDKNREVPCPYTTGQVLMVGDKNCIKCKNMQQYINKLWIELVKSI
jgi:hypothetical protein